MSRPGILQEWPLDEFLHRQKQQQQQWSPMKKPQKRPLSPTTASAPSLFSPTKRRILVQEGIFSPEKVLKSPFVEPPLLRRPNSEPAPAPAPVAESSAAASKRAHSLPVLPTPFLDGPESIHYPGFVVHRDSTAAQQDLLCEDSGDEADNDDDDDNYKENLVPKTKSSKKISTKPLVFSPLLPLAPPVTRHHAHHELHTPSTPSKKAHQHQRYLPGSPTPKRSRISAGVVLTSTSAQSTPVLTEAEKRERRKILEHEVDHPDTVSSDSDSELDENALI